MAKKGEDTFIEVGFDNWKKALERFAQHAQSGPHKDALLKIEVLGQESVHALLSKQAMAEQKVHREVLLKQLSSLKYLLRQGLAIRGHEEMEGNLLQLLQLRSDDCPELKTWVSEHKYFSPDILNEQIALMGLSAVREVLKNIRSVEWFSLLADEATDISNKEQLVICIRWVDINFDIHEDPVELIHVPKTDSLTIASAIKDCLIRHCLPISQCRGQAYDGASSMSGHLNGVAARIQQDVPSALFVHCLAHCTNLCLQSVGRLCLPIRDAIDLVMELSKLIRYSPKRTALFETLQSQLANHSPSLKPLCPTRWTVRTGAIQSVLSNYSVLCEALVQINLETHDDYGRKAGGYLAQMGKFSTYFGLKLSHLIFSGIEQLSITLQGKNTTVQEAVMAADLAVCYLRRQRTDGSFDSFYSRVVDGAKELTALPALPRYRQPPKRMDDGSSAHRFSDPECYFRKQYFEVLDLLISELQRRFQQKRGMPVAAIIEKILLDAANGAHNNGELPQELQLYKNDIDLARFKIQLQMIPDLIRTRNQKLTNSAPITKVTNVRTICDIMNDVTISKDMLSEVHRMLQIFYTVPVTTSTAERTFSALRRLKTFLRSTMSQPRLNHMMTLYVHKDQTDRLCVNVIARMFVNVNDRRKQYFGCM